MSRDSLGRMVSIDGERRAIRIMCWQGDWLVSAMWRGIVEVDRQSEGAP